jgi:transposase
LIDGAPYHHSDEITNYLKRNNVALFIAAPYAYDAAPCEMFFSYFKSKDLNPEHLKTGKR